MTEQTGDTIKCVSDHVVDLSDGRTVPPGETAENVDLKDPHNAQLVDDKHIVKLSDPKGDK